MTNQPRLHILHLTDGNRGGSQRHIVDLCRDGTPATRHYVLRVADQTISLHDPARDRMLVLSPPASPGGLAGVVATAVAELGIGCLHAHALPVLLGAVPAPERTPGDIPLVVTLHDLGCIDPGLFASQRTAPLADAAWIARLSPALRAARAVIVPSAYLARELATHYPGLVPVVIPNGIAAAPSAVLPIDPPWPARARVFAVVGALGPHKGSDTLLRVAAALHDPDVVGVVIGYTNLQTTPGWIVPGRLYLHGRYAPDELPGLLGAYRVRLAYFPNVIPESFSYALSEVWQAGVPALAPAIGALGDRVGAAGAGWLLDDPQDAPAAAAAILRLLGPDGAPELAAAAARLRPPATVVPDIAAMRADTGRIHRMHAHAAAGDPDAGWVRLRALWRDTLLRGADDCALDAEWPALVREEMTLRDWNGKLTADVAQLEATSQHARAQLTECIARARQLEVDVAALKARNARIEAEAASLAEGNAALESDLALRRARALELERDGVALRARNRELESGIVALKARNAHIEADTLALGRRNAEIEVGIVALTQRSIELDSDVVALKERNTLVEADIVLLKRRNSRVEEDAAALQAEIARTRADRDGARERMARLERELAAAEAAAKRLEGALNRLPVAARNWILRHA